MIVQFVSAGFDCVRLGAEVLVNRSYFGVVGVGEGFDFLAGLPRQRPDFGIGFWCNHRSMRIKVLGIRLVDAWCEYLVS